MKAAIKTITICSSAAFYEHVNQLAAELETQRFRAIVPVSARRMAKSGDYTLDTLKTWYQNPKDFEKKATLMREHFDEVNRADAILVVNDKKHDIEGYIGPNVLMEMGLAFYLKKPIFVLNPIDEKMPVYEEVLGMGSIIIEGDISKL